MRRPATRFIPVLRWLLSQGERSGRTLEHQAPPIELAGISSGVPRPKETNGLYVGPPGRLAAKRSERVANDILAWHRKTIPMIKRILSFALVAAVLSFASSAVWAAVPKPFEAAAFKQAKSDGKTVLVDFAASWCPTCKQQGPIIESLLKSEKFGNVVAFKADYDTEKDLKKELKVASQSTLVVFKGGKEVARAAGIATPEAIGALLAKGL